MTFNEFIAECVQSMRDAYGIDGGVVFAGIYKVMQPTMPILVGMIVLGLIMMTLYQCIRLGTFINNYGLDEDWRAMGRGSWWFITGGHKMH